MSSQPAAHAALARRFGTGEQLGRDLRLALRTLRRAPGYTAAAVIVLALGIGANTAIFSAVRAVLLDPLPFPDGDRLVLVHQATADGRVPNAFVSVPEYYAYRARLRDVRDLVEYHRMTFTLLEQGDPDRVATGVVSANFFSMLGVRPLLGRTFVAADAQHGAEPVLVLSYGYWKKKFGGDPHAVGRIVEMNDRAHTIVGVLPDFPQYPNENDVYMPTSACPFRAQADDPAHQQQGFRTFAGLSVFGRLAPHATVDRATAEVNGIAQGFAHQHSADYQANGPLTAQVQSLHESLARDARPILLALAAITGLVLLLACTNVANLAIARAMRRQRELAVRRALGAGAGDLFRQLLVESLVVAVIGGGLGLLLAASARGLLGGFVSRYSTRGEHIAIDGGVLLFALGVSLLTGFLFGTLPAASLQRNLAGAVRQGSAGAGTRKQRLRAVLVVGQVAVSFALLVGTGLLLASLYRLATVRLGYDARNVLAASFFGNFTTMDTPEHIVRIHSEILDRVQELPGVTSAAVTASVPLSNIRPGLSTVHIEGQTGTTPQVDPNVGSEGYFETLGVPLLAGRTFRRSDDAEAPQVAVINQSLASQWGGRDPIGSRFYDDNGTPNPDGSRAWMTVIGVVADFQLYGQDKPMLPQYYVTFRQGNNFAGRVLVRTQGDPHRLAPLVAAAVHAVDPQSPVADVQTLEELRAGHLQVPRLTAVLLAIFAGVALLVTLAGLAGVIGTSVGQRTREFGIRLALGASRLSVLAMVLGEGAVLVAGGIALGLLGARGLGRLLGSYLFQTPPTDLAAYGIGAVLLAFGALAATFAPARRATATEPMVTLRAE